MVKVGTGVFWGKSVGRVVVLTSWGRVSPMLVGWIMAWESLSN